jgi:xanthine dehydrogenase molybdopterin-binding subunit B
VIVAETEPLARRAARAVQVAYEPLPAILSIEDAIAAGSFYKDYNSVIIDGDVDAAFAPGGGVERVVEGTFRIGGQEHFYLEPHNCLVVPSENDEFLLVSSTQVGGAGWCRVWGRGHVTPCNRKGRGCCVGRRGGGHAGGCMLGCEVGGRRCKRVGLWS